jgi:uncharacterized protein YgfB (UPF0149 family)
MNTKNLPVQAPGHAELSSVLAALRLGVQPSDLHGSLSGYLCAGTQATEEDWLDRLELAPDTAEVAQAPLLRALYRHACAQFESTPARVEPLLPSPDQSIALRAQALVEWCRGFLGGFGLAGVTARAPLSGDAEEILTDFAAIAASRLEHDNDVEDASAFADVLAFVCTASALLQREVQASARITARSLH